MNRSYIKVRNANEFCNPRKRGVIELSINLLSDRAHGVLSNAAFRRWVYLLLEASRSGNKLPIADDYAEAELIQAGFVEKYEADAEAEHLDKHSSRYIPESIKGEVALRDGFKCKRCGRIDDLQFDHIVPVSKGGSSDDSMNVQILCGPCNRRKSNRHRGAA